jgi:hypothetical protein
VQGAACGIRLHKFPAIQLEHLACSAWQDASSAQFDCSIRLQHSTARHGPTHSTAKHTKPRQDTAPHRHLQLPPQQRQDSWHGWLNAHPRPAQHPHTWHPDPQSAQLPGRCAPPAGSQVGNPGGWAVYGWYIYGIYSVDGEGQAYTGRRVEFSHHRCTAGGMPTVTPIPEAGSMLSPVEQPTHPACIACPSTPSAPH